MSSRVIAIDGPSASGKSTVARAVAGRLGYRYVDSGALYRAVTWRALQTAPDTTDAAGLAAWVRQIRVDLVEQPGAIRFSIDGRTPDDADLRASPVVEAVSDVAAVPAVRETVGERLRSMTRFGNLVVEGRDIGTAVFPDAPFKFFIDADPAERARRRSAESGDDEHTVQASLQRRDKKDSSRPTAPLRRAHDAVLIDTTHLTIEQVVSQIIDRVMSAESFEV
jgi:CMP/dCMP kinase